MIRGLVLALLVVSLVSCQPQPQQTTQAPEPLPDFPFATYRPTLGAMIYKIDGNHSRADILVRRGGTLARFGHDHVVSATRIDGYMLLFTNDLNRSQADLRLALDSLIVDDPIARKQFALDTKPTQQDVEKTIENMHTKVLQTENWPQIHLKVEPTGGSLDALTAQLSVQLHGEAHSFPITINTEGMGTELIQANGTFSLRQSDYGITPFTILGGGLQVLDQVDVTFRLQAAQVIQ